MKLTAKEKMTAANSRKKRKAMLSCISGTLIKCLNLMLCLMQHLTWLNVISTKLISSQCNQRAVFPTNLHARWLQGFALPYADRSALFTICFCFAIIVVFLTLLCPPTFLGTRSQAHLLAMSLMAEIKVIVYNKLLLYTRQKE